MTERELQMYADRCSIELEKKQKQLKADFGLSGQDEYVLDLDSRILRFEKDSVLRCQFSVIVIGSLAPVSKNWLWGWANESLREEFRERAAVLNALYDETGFDIFKVGTFKADANLARELSALAVHSLDAAGLYRVPGGEDQDGQVQIYLALFPA